LHGAGALKAAGNREECPVQAKDTRCRIVGSKKSPQIASWAKGHYRLMTGGTSVGCDCFTREIAGVLYSFHYTGWSQKSGGPTGTENPFPYRGTSFAFWEMREAAQ
jgi:hypothetical protein